MAIDINLDKIHEQLGGAPGKAKAVQETKKVTKTPTKSNLENKDVKKDLLNRLAQKENKSQLSITLNASTADIINSLAKEYNTSKSAIVQCILDMVIDGGNND